MAQEADSVAVVGNTFFNFFRQQRAAAISLRKPGSRSAAACRALGDNVLSAPRKRERTAVCVCEFGLSRAPPCRRDVTPDASD